jgi:Amt family ammonium transporter
MGAAIFGYMAVQLRNRLNVDDALDVWACHGVGGTWGAIATGVFASLAINSAGANGLLHGNPRQIAIQLIAVLIVWAYSAAATWGILKLVDAVIGLRVEEREEILGLDATQHGEVAYQT